MASPSVQHDSAAEARIESAAAAEVKIEIRELIDYVVLHPSLWNWGDGEGGWLHEEIDKAARARGLL